MSFLYIGIPGITSSGTAGNDTIYGGNNDDSLSGGAGNDYIYSYPETGATLPDGNDLIAGGDGIDTLYPGTGSDSLDGGSGYDYLPYRWGSQTIHHIDLSMTLDLGTNTETRVIRKYDVNNNLLGTDQFSAIEFIRGTTGTDTFYSSDPAYRSTLGYNNISLQGWGGSDTFTQNSSAFSPSLTVPNNRGQGMQIVYDWVQADANGKGIEVRYVESTATVKYFNTASGQVAGTDTLVSIGRIYDSNANDVIDLTLATGSNFAYATRPKQDFISHHIIGINGGSDTVLGNGATQIHIANPNATLLSGSGATIDLSKGSANLSNLSGYGTLTFSGIAGLVGTKFNDSLTGGGPADSVLEIFNGQQGNDTIDGAGGYDSSNYDSATNGVSVDLAAGVVSGGNWGTDTLLHVEGIRGTDYDDTFDSRGFGSQSTNAGSLGTFNLFAPDGGNDVVYGNGNTTVSYVNSWIGVKVDLALGADALNLVDKSNANYAVSLGKDTFMGGVNAATGSLQNDWLVGTDTNDPLSAETYEGEAGNDTLVGNGGMDWASYSDSPAGITVDLRKSSNQVSDGWGGIDSLQGIEGIRGSYADDVMRGSDALTVNEVFKGMQGADSMDGGQGFNIASFVQDVQGVTVWLEASSRKVAPGVGVADKVQAGFTGVALDGWGDIDQLANIEGVEGSLFNDLIVGNADSNHLDGRKGNDTLDGGAGFDWAEFNNAEGAVTVNLATQSASDGDGGTDRLLNMEGVLGSLQNDQVSGDGLANILDGNGGNDTLDGSGGDDVLKGQDGNDVLISGMGRDYLLGGNGTDTLKLTPSGTWSGSYWAQNDFLVATGVQTASHKMTPLSGLNRFESVSNGGADYDTLELTTGNDALALDDILTQMNSEAAAELGRVVDIELINAGDGNDMVDLSSTRFNSTGIKVDGGAGNDVLWGGVGADQLLGGTGNDVLLGATGNDTLTGGAGADSFLFAAGSGQDTITDFSVASGDKVRLLGGTTSGATVAYSSNNADTLLAWNGQQVTLTGVQLTGTAWFEYSA